MKGNDREAVAATEALRRMQEATQALVGAPGPKALLRRFGEALARHFGVQRFECARISGRGAARTLKRRGVRVPGLDVLSDETIAALQSVLLDTDPTLGELRDGCIDLSAGGTELTVAVTDDPVSARGCLVAWERPAGMQPLDRAVMDALVRALQNESRWLRKLDKTQALLYKDDLTGLYNYRYFEIALDAELRRADRFNNQFCLLFLDLDGFKPINDNHGHPSGSSVLKQVADVLREAVREVDVPIRYGGDEFVVVLLGATCSKGLLAAERVRKRIEAREFRVDGGGICRLTASIGIAAFPEHGRDRETLLKVADETMYNSKKSGKNRVTVVGKILEP